MRPIRLLPFVALAFVVASFAAEPGAAAGGGTWTLTTSDFQTQAVALRSIDNSGVKVAASAQEGGAGERVVPFDQFMQLERAGAGGGASDGAAKAAEGKFTLYLVGGD